MKELLITFTAQGFSDSGKAWIEAISGVLNSAIAQFGILAAAAIGVWKSLTTKAELKSDIRDAKQEISERLDRQAKRIDTVALAVPPTNGQPTTISQPEQVTIQP